MRILGCFYIALGCLALIPAALEARKHRNPPLPIRGEDAANAAGEGTGVGGATRPVIPA